jgi:GNAT superfamily N-acetyltransferase|tara:strand:+ start:160 stop:696 length:537 start_codon:yes stop_codon:yes gene_type:complete
MTIEKSSDLAGDYEIRLAGKEDANGISRLLQELLTFYGLPLKYQRSYMSHVIENEAFLENSGLKIFIALENNKPVAFLAFSKVFALATCQTSIFIQDLYVERKTRNKGIGYALMEVLVKYGLENEVTQIDWTADTWNSKAINFYEHITTLQKTDKIYYRLNKDKLSAFLNKTKNTWRN